MFILFLSFVYSEVYEKTTIYDWYGNVGLCKAFSNASPSINTVACNYNGNLINDKIKTDVFLYAFKNAYFTFNFNVTLNQTKPYNYAIFSSCSEGQVTPKELKFYSIKNGIKTYVGNWVNSNSSCGTDTAGCFSHGNDYAINLTEANTSTYLVTVYPKNCAFSGFYRADFAEFNFSYVNFTVNQLPYANITVNDMSCIDNSYGSWARYNFTVDSYDVEGDTIYYSTIPDVYYNIDIILTFDQQSTLIDWSRKLLCYSFSFLSWCDEIYRLYPTNILPQDQSSNLDTNCSMQFNIFDQSETASKSIFYLPNSNINNGFRLGFNSALCSDGDQSLGFINKKPFYNDSSFTTRLEIELKNGTTGIIYPSYFNIIESTNLIIFNRTAGKTYLRVGLNLYNTTKNPIELRQFLSYDTNTYTFGVYEPDTVDSDDLYSTNLELRGKNRPDIYVYLSNGTAYFDNVQFARGSFNYSFSTTVPTYLDFYKTGVWENYILVTDSVHLNSEYNLVPFTSESLYCSHWTDSQKKLDNTTFHPFIFIKDFGNNNQNLNFILSVTTEESANSILFWIYVICLAFLFLTFKEFFLSFIISNLLFLGISIFFGLTTMVIGFTVLTVLSLSPMLAKLILGETS